MVSGGKMKVFLVLLTLLFSIQGLATEPVHSGDKDLQVTTRYVQSATTVEERIPTEFFEIPDDSDRTDKIEVKLDDVFPEDPEEIPSYRGVELPKSHQ
jgi:hypothetical protein